MEHVSCLAMLRQEVGALGPSTAEDKHDHGHPLLLSVPAVEECVQQEGRRKDFEVPKYCELRRLKKL